MSRLKLVHSAPTPAPTAPPSPTRNRITPQSVGLKPVRHHLECCGEPLEINMMFVDMEKSRSFIVGDHVYMQLRVPCIFCYEETPVLLRGQQEDLRG